MFCDCSEVILGGLLGAPIVGGKRWSISCDRSHKSSQSNKSSSCSWRIWTSWEDLRCLARDARSSPPAFFVTPAEQLRPMSAQRLHFWPGQTRSSGKHFAHLLDTCVS